MDDVNCNGDEADLTWCYYSTSHNCGHSEDVGVICMDEYVDETSSAEDFYLGSFALIVDPNWPVSYDENGWVAEISGRMEYYNGYSYGTVCDDYFDNDSNGAAVFCRSMGLPFGGAYYVPAWESGTGDINMDDVQCTGDEWELTECYYIADHNCGHSEDAGVVCTGGYGYGDEAEAAADEENTIYSEDGLERLVLNPDCALDFSDINFAPYGRVEVWSDSNGWGTVCDDVFDSDGGNAANAFCRSLGFAGGDSISWYGGSYNH